MERKEEGLTLVKCPPYFAWDECFISSIPLIPISPYKVGINFSYFIEKEYVRETGQVTKLGSDGIEICTLRSICPKVCILSIMSSFCLRFMNRRCITNCSYTRRFACTVLFYPYNNPRRGI